MTKHFSSTYYLAGPMTGHPQFNIPLFKEVASKLEDQGYKVINPCELDDSKWYDICLNSPDGDLTKAEEEAGESLFGAVLSKDVAIVSDADSVILLPGWENSRGSCLEVITAILQGVTLYEWDSAKEQIIYLSSYRALQLLNRNVLKTYTTG